VGTGQNKKGGVWRRQVGVMNGGTKCSAGWSAPKSASERRKAVRGPGDGRLTVFEGRGHFCPFPRGQRTNPGSKTPGEGHTVPLPVHCPERDRRLTWQGYPRPLGSRTEPGSNGKKKNKEKQETEREVATAYRGARYVGEAGWPGEE